MTTALSAQLDEVSLGRTVLLKNASLTVERGTSVAITGPPGSGKSMLIRALCGLHAAQARVTVDDTSNTQDGWTAVQARMGVLLSQPGLLDEWPLHQNVAWRLIVSGVPREEAEQRARQALQWVGLTGAEDRLPREVSGGMQRRAALARALVHRPSLLLLDDPTAGLDPITAAQVVGRIFLACRAQDAAVVWTTHDATVVSRSSRVFALEHAALVEQVAA